MRGNKRALLAAGLLAGAAAMTGCTADTRPAATPTAQSAQQQTAQPTDASNATAGEAPDETPSPEEEKPERLALLVDGSETENDAVKEEGTVSQKLERSNTIWDDMAALLRRGRLFLYWAS